NVRQLRNAVRRAAGLSREQLIGPDDLAGPPAIEPTVESPGRTDQGGGELSVDHDRDFKDAKEAVVEAFEAQYLARLFEICDENVTRTAERAGLSRYHTRQLLEKHGLRE
ncbi:MAG: hypothetical protein ABEL76_17550, partial [Bradymonadaceae bacterium]